MLTDPLKEGQGIELRMSQPFIIDTATEEHATRISTNYAQLCQTVIIDCKILIRKTSSFAKR